MISLLLLLISLVFLILIFYQDMRYRAVTWIIFPLAAIALGAYSLTKASLSDVAFRSLINLLFVGLIMLMLFIFFFIRHRKISSLTTALGLGDILFFIVIAFLFSPVQYMLFFCASLFLTTLIATIVPAIRNNVPLAGAQALMLMPLMLLDQLRAIDLSDDNWILQWLS